MVTNAATGAAWPAGAFKVHTVRELSALAAGRGDSTAPTSTACVFEIIARRPTASENHVEVSALQAAVEPGGHRHMFQVASNFNCLEVPSVRTDPAGGDHVTNLMYDSTQGPAAASGAAVAALTRCHAVFFDPAAPDDTWGQTATHQIELLGHAALKPHFPVVNGKLYPFECDSEGDWWDVVKSPGAWADLIGHVGIGLHIDAPVNFARDSTPSAALLGCSFVRPSPVVDQVFVAALNRRAFGVSKLPREETLSKMRFLLQAAYEGTYAAAVAREVKVLVLTCVGGGVFCNPLEDVAAAIAAAHAKWSTHLGCKLIKVVLPLFSIEADPSVFVSKLRDVGVSVNVNFVE